MSSFAITVFAFVYIGFVFAVAWGISEHQLDYSKQLLLGKELERDDDLALLDPVAFEKKVLYLRAGHRPSSP